MRIKVPIILLVVMLVVRPLSAADVIDRIVATVNRTILQRTRMTSWLRSVHRRPLSNLRLKNARAGSPGGQELLRQQMPDNDPQLRQATGHQRQLQEVRKQSPAAETDQAWHFGTLQSVRRRQENMSMQVKF
jgi:hypothetical protein